ncbi:aspartyl-phosphate phosphatase Spo0E family protein [Clostridiaceae bacterium 35-E11]
MLKYEIEQLQHRLNHLIEFGYSYEEIYQVSVELDRLISEFYKAQRFAMV